MVNTVQLYVYNSMLWKLSVLLNSVHLLYYVVVIYCRTINITKAADKVTRCNHQLLNVHQLRPVQQLHYVHQLLYLSISKSQPVMTISKSHCSKLRTQLPQNQFTITTDLSSPRRFLASDLSLSLTKKRLVLTGGSICKQASPAASPNQPETPFVVVL